MIGGRVDMRFQIVSECSGLESGSFVYGTNRSGFFERDQVGLCVNGNWQIWVRYCDGETVSIHMAGEATAGFSNVKTLHLVH